MWTFLEIIITLITMPFFIKANDWCWGACLIYIGCCMLFTPLVGIPVYLFAFSR